MDLPMRSSPLHRWWWLWLSLGWVVVGLAFAAQTVWLGGFAWDAAIAWAVLDWGFWIPLAPLVVWLARRLEITAQTWYRTVPVHIVAALLMAALIEFASVFAFQWGWMPDPRPGPRVSGEEASRSFGPGGDRTRRDPGSPGFRPPPDFDHGPGPGGGSDHENPVWPGPGGPERRGPDGPGREGPRRRFPIGTGRGRLALPIYFVILVGTQALAYHRRSLDRERRALLAETKLAEAQVMAMQTQLQPHFFFNALNTVASLIFTQPEEAEETICALGELMRGVLDASHRREISLREELAFVDRYLAVQRIRFRDRLLVVREIPEETLACAVPPLLLQPLVENAVVHGVAPLPVPGTVTLRAHREANHLLLEVENTVAPPDDPAEPAEAESVTFTPRIGLTNTRTRLEALYGADFRFSHRRTPEGCIVTTVAVPWKWSQA